MSGEKMVDKYRSHRCDFLKHAAGALGAATQVEHWPAFGAMRSPRDGEKLTPTPEPGEIRFPRQFQGPQLKMISFPLGGVAAGSIGLGGRGQLRDWEIFNRPNKGFR